MLLIVGLLVATGCGGGGSGETAGSSITTVDATSTTAPDGPPQGAELVSISDLEEDSCFDVASDSKSMTRAAWLIDCAKPHDFEMYAIVTHRDEASGRGAAYPGTSHMADLAEQRCYDLFEAFVGVRWSISDLDIRTWWPSQQSWDNHDRKFLCAVTRSDGDAMTGTQRGTKN